MEIFGKIWKDGKFWLIEIPLLNAMTQGKTRKDALRMGEDLIYEMIVSYFPTQIDESFHVTIHIYDNEIIGVSTTNNNLIYALSLIRQREISGCTIREASKHLGSLSPNAYAQYETGKKRMSLEKYDRLLLAANPLKRAMLGVA